MIVNILGRIAATRWAKAALRYGTIALTIVLFLLSFRRSVAACPPVVEYSREFQARAADELAMLPARSVVVEMMGDYTVMRNQARACISI